MVVTFQYDTVSLWGGNMFSLQYVMSSKRKNVFVAV